MAGLLPPAQAWGKAGLVVGEALGFGVPRPFAAPVRRMDATLDGVTGHMYLPGRPSPAILLLPGAAPRGKDDPRAVRLAGALARSGRVVFVPDLRLADRQLDPGDVETIVRATLGLDSHPAVRGRVQMLGISYGGSFGLIAAADPRVRGRLEQVAVFGAYWDLVGLLQAATTGVSVVDGRRYEWTPHPRAEEILREEVVRVLPQDSRPGVREALRGRGSPEDLDPGGRALYEVVTNRDPSLTRALVEELPSETRDLLRDLSPSSVAGAITAPVVAMHSADDLTTPYGEAVRMKGDLPRSRLVTVKGFSHVDFRTPAGLAGAAADLWGAWRFAAWVLGPGE